MTSHYRVASNLVTKNKFTLVTICIEFELVYVARHCEMLPRSFPELKRMLTISKALSAGQAQTYHAREFSSEQQNYWNRNRLAFSEWRGALAEEWSLRGSVQADHFARRRGDQVAQDT